MIFLLCLALLGFPSGGKGGEVPDAAIEYYEHGEFQRAVEILSQRARYSTEDATLRYWLGKSYYRLRKWNDAIRELEKASQIQPANSTYHLWLGRAYGKKAEHTPFFAALGPARRVLKEFETAVSLSPTDTNARFDLMEYYLEAPGIVGGGREKALAQANQIAQLNRRLGFAAHARLYEKDKKPDLALKELMQATIEFPKDTGTWSDLADFFLNRSDYVQAAEKARKALELGPNLKAQLILAATQVKLAHNLVEAEQSLRGMIAGPLTDDDPPFEEIHYWLGKALLGQGRKFDARQAFELALMFNPEHAGAKTAMAKVR